jgi:pSer/pThr/pTyr-binding forkhead associated (FHA) protein
MARKAVQHVMKGLTSSAENAFFRVMNGSAEGQRIEIADAQEYIFGRDSADADVVLKDDLVSRTHAKVRRDWSGTHVEDLDSRNGIRVNKKRVTQATLRDKDELTIGSVRLLFIDPAESREESSSQLQRPDPGEGTESVRAEPEPPPPAVAASPPEPSEPDAPEALPEEAAEGDAYDESGDVGSEEAPVDDDDGESPQGLNVRSRQQMIALGIGAVMVVVGLVVLILLLIGA